MSASETSPTQQFVAALDIGTTTIRCFIYDRHVQIKGSAVEQVELLYPEPHHVEIDPERLWQSIVRTIRAAIADAQLSAASLATLGISTQRSTFVTWHRETGQTFHNLITWKDLRADALVKKWNNSYILKTMHGISRCMYLLTRKSRFRAGSVLKLMNSQTTMRLAWMIQHNRALKEAIAGKVAMFGTLDSWLLYRLRRGDGSGGRQVEHIADVSSCAATGFYDPFTLGWAQWAFKLFDLHGEMMPRVVTNSHDFGHVHASVLGHEVRIGCTIGDQSASMWGSCCFKKGDMKITLGTGSFLDVVTGDECHASIYGMYPLVAWQTQAKPGVNKEPTETVYCVEGSASDTGSIIKWAMDFGLFENPADSAAIAQSVQDTDGVYFVPAFSGLGAPINDSLAASGLIGLQPSTKNAHIVRAVLESIAFRVAQLYDCTLNETKFQFTIIRVDGGVSKNDFICQLLADLTGLHVERSVDSELSVLGAGFLAGLNCGYWTSRDELLRLRKIERTFVPSASAAEREAAVSKLRDWERAVERFRGWYAVDGKGTS